MTAEVAVMNRLGIALATDSAVTVTLEKDIRKTYQSAEKLFQLSERAPVGLMTYGKAGFLDMPWETVAKAYRTKLGTRTFDTIHLYVKDFVRFIQNDRQLFPTARRRAELGPIVGGFYRLIRGLVKNELDAVKSKKKSKLSEADIRSSVDKVIATRLASIRKYKYSEGITGTYRKSLQSKLRSALGKYRTDVFGKLPMSPATRRKILTLGIELLIRQFFRPSSSGVVIAGFGEKEYSPALLALQLDGMVENRVRYFVEIKRAIGDDAIASVVPFAQQDMVCTFMEGIAPDLRKLVEDSTKTLFTSVATDIIGEVSKRDKKLGKELEQLFQPNIKKILQKLLENWDQSCKDGYWYPIVNMVSALPKDELAAMAEALVSLTKFRRRVSPDEETVAGPIDVALITKGDGFVWVRRKHYFDPDLNPRVMARYIKGQL